MDGLVVPKGLLIARSPLEAGLDVESASRPIDHVQLTADNFLSRARASSIDLGGLGRTRETGQEFPHVNPMPIAARDSRPQSPDEDLVDPLEKQKPVNRPTRGHTISSGSPTHARFAIPLTSESPSNSSLYSLASSTSASFSNESLSNISGYASIRPGPPRRATRDESGIFLSSDLRRFSFTRKDDVAALTNEKIEVQDFAQVGTIGGDAQFEQQQQQTQTQTLETPNILRQASTAIRKHARQSSLYDLYEKAKFKNEKLKRKPWVQRTFEYAVYFFLVAFIYLVLVGLPLWKGAVWWLFWVVQNKFILPGGFAIIIGLAALYAFAPLLIFFDKDPPALPADTVHDPQPSDVCLLIPCYKSGKIIGATLEAAVKLFPRENIFVIANGNSPTPLDDTADVCAEYGVSHTWSPLGSKIIAQFVGCHVSKQFPYTLLIDDDCLLPPTFPLGTDKFTDRIKCIGYTITSVGPNGSKGTLVQQAQDLEYKMSGLQRQFAGLVGSATFPHGAISMWDREFLLQTFHEHPGFSVSEDWFFGHVARTLGSRIIMNSEVFVETETPAAIFWAGKGGSRGGFGEMTVWKQRFERWNFFFVNGLYWNMRYILCSWKLGFWEIGSKIFVFQEVYETLLYLLTPFVLPISFIVRPSFCGYLLAGTIVLYFINSLIFNLVHLRRKRKVTPTGEITTQALSTKALLFYIPYKFVLTGVNVVSCYYSIFKYAKYFATRHPKVVEDEKVVEVVLNLDERSRLGKGKRDSHRRLTLTAVVNISNSAAPGEIV